MAISLNYDAQLLFSIHVIITVNYNNSKNNKTDNKNYWKFKFSGAMSSS